MAPRLPVSDDEDFEVADYEMLSESSESFADPSSDEDFVVEVRHGDIHRLHYDEDQQQQEDHEVVYDLNVLFDEDNVDSDDNSDDNDFNPLEFNNDMSDAEMVDVEEEAPIIGYRDNCFRVNLKTSTQMRLLSHTYSRDIANTDGQVPLGNSY